MNQIFDHYLHSRDDEEVDRDINPYDSVIDKRIVRRVTNPKKSYIEKMKFDYFKKSVKWGNSLNFPGFLIEVIKYISGFDINYYLELKKEIDIEEKD